MHNELVSLDFRPGTGRALAFGWKQMKANALLFFLVALVIVVIEIPSQSQNYNFTSEDPIKSIHSLLLLAFMILIAPVFNYGADFVFLKGVRGDDVLIKSILDGFKCYVNVVLSNLLTFGLTAIGFVAFIFPGIFIACRLVFTAYLVMDEDMDPVAAVEASWRMTQGHALKIFLLGVLSIFIFFGGLLLFVIGVFPALMWIKASFAALYLSIQQESAPTETSEPSE